MERKQKILVCGDVEGKFKTLFGRITAINDKNGPFDFLFCVGDFFGDSLSNWEPYKNGTLTVPVPTYILGPHKDNQIPIYDDLSGCEMCPNVSYLGKRGLLTSSGLSIAYVSGFEGMDDSAIHFTKADVTAVKEIAFKSKVANNFLGVDILLSSVWPRNITTGLEGCSFKDTLKRESDHLAWLASQLRPRYHFAGIEDIYFERPPYENYHIGNETSVHCTRFISLAKVGSSGKNKWLYAANLTAIENMKASELYQFTTDQTPCPYKNPTSNQTSGSKQYFYDMNAVEDVGKKRKRDRTEYDGKRQNIDQNSCWFCLGSPKVEKHLVVSIGEQVYLALAKGGITEHHVMILPVQHHRSFAFISDEIKSEVKKFKSALKKYFKKLKMVPVFFERNYKTSHMQMHVVPVPKNAAGKLKQAFLTGAEENGGLELSELPEHCKLEDSTQPDSPYFYIELPTSERMFCSCKKSFPLEFGRDVLAGDDILGLPHRVSWRDCIVSKDEEVKMAGDFREGFKEFDFTMVDDDEGL